MHKTMKLEGDFFFNEINSNFNFRNLNHSFVVKTLQKMFTVKNKNENIFFAKQKWMLIMYNTF